MYDMILENTKEARAAIEEEDWGALREEIKDARGVVNELMKSLDFHYSLSSVLMDLYISVDKRLTLVPGNRDSKDLDDVDEVIKKLRSDFNEIAKEDHSESVMENSEAIYSGLTYGKNSLNESVDSGNKKRGFTV